MKNIKFLKRCRDKNTGERYDIGQIKQFTNKRAAEIVKTGKAVYDNSDETK